MRAPSRQSSVHTWPAAGRAPSLGSHHEILASRHNGKGTASRGGMAPRLSQDFLASACAPALLQKALLAMISHPLNAVSPERPLPMKNTDHAFQQTQQCLERRNAPSVSIDIRPGHSAIRARGLHYLQNEYRY